MKGTIRVRLDAEDFRAMINGGIIIVGREEGQEKPIELILADIGWGQMMAIIREAMQARAEPAEPCIIPPGEPLSV